MKSLEQVTTFAGLEMLVFRNILRTYLMDNPQELLDDIK